jgi:hypothetical protein
MPYPLLLKLNPENNVQFLQKPLQRPTASYH